MGVGWREDSTNVYTGRLRPEVQPLTLLYTIFQEKGTPFVYPLMPYSWDRMDRFSFSTVMEYVLSRKIANLPCLLLCIPFNLCKYTIFYIGINHKHKTFS